MKEHHHAMLQSTRRRQKMHMVENIQQLWILLCKVAFLTISYLNTLRNLNRVC